MRVPRPQRHVARVAVARSCVLAHQEEELRRTWKFRRVAETTVPLVESLTELLQGALQRLRSRRRPRRSGLLHRAQLRRQRFGRLLDLRTFRPPDARNLAEDVDESRPPPSRRRREIGAAVKRLQVRRQPHAHRPTTRTGCRLNERHVHAVDVGALFTIDLD